MPTEIVIVKTCLVEGNHTARGTEINVDDDLARSLVYDRRAMFKEWPRWKGWPKEDPEQKKRREAAIKHAVADGKKGIGSNESGRAPEIQTVPPTGDEKDKD